MEKSGRVKRADHFCLQWNTFSLCRILIFFSLIPLFFLSCLGNNTCQNGSIKLLDLEEANNSDLDSGGSRGRTTHLFYSGNNSTFNNSSTPSSKWNDNSSSGISITNISAAGDDMTITVSK